MFNYFFEDLVRRLLVQQAGRAVRVGPRASPPSLQAERYAADLRRLVDQLEYALIQRLFELTKQDSRFDARVSEVVADVLEKIVAIYRREVSNSWSTTARSVDEHNRRETDKQWQAVLGIDYPERGSALREELESYRDQNVDLITNMTEEQLEVIKKELRALGPGATVSQVAAMLRNRMRVTRSRASLIARDQVLKLNSQLTRIRHREAGVDKYTWSASMDERTRQSTDKTQESYNKWQDHRALNGKVFSWDDPPVVNKKTGDRAHPGEYFQCRCVADPVFEIRGRNLS